MTYEEAFASWPKAKYIVCRQCQRQHPYYGAAEVIVAYVDLCPECETRGHDWNHHFLWWLVDCRPQGTWDAVGALAEAVKRDANAITLPTYEETEEYLRARGFCVTALPVAWAEWLQWKKK